MDEDEPVVDENGPTAVDENERRKLTFNKGAFYVQPFLSDLPARNLLGKGKMKIPPVCLLMYQVSWKSQHSGSF